MWQGSTWTSGLAPGSQPHHLATLTAAWSMQTAGTCCKPSSCCRESSEHYTAASGRRCLLQAQVVLTLWWNGSRLHVLWFLPLVKLSVRLCFEWKVIFEFYIHQILYEFMTFKTSCFIRKIWNSQSMTEWLDSIYESWSHWLICFKILLKRHVQNK